MRAYVFRALPMKLRTYYILLAMAILVPAAIFCAIALKVMLDAQHDSAI